jgi:hypothetical protein
MSSVRLLKVSNRTYRTYEPLALDRVGNCDIQRIEIPTDLVSIISGSRGERMRRLEQDTNCRIQFEKNHDDGGVTIASMLKVNPTKLV